MTSTSLVFDILAKDRASATFDRLGTSSTRAGGHLSNLGTRLKSVAKYAALAAAAGAVLAVKWGVDAVKAAAADDQAQQILANALKRNTDATKAQVAAVEDWIAKQGVAYGVADDDLRPAYQRLAETTGSMAKAQELASLAMDVAAGKGKTTRQVSEALAKAYEGNIGALGRLGVKTKDAEGNTLTFDQAVKGLADTFGGQAATKAETYQGKMDRLKIVYEETKEAIGAKLLPVLTTLATWFLTKGIPAIQKTWTWLHDKLGPVFSTVGDFIGGLVQKAGPMTDSMLPKMRDMWDAVKDALRDAGPFFTLIKGLAGEVGKVFMTVLLPASQKIASVVLPVLAENLRITGKVLGALGRIGVLMWNNSLQPVFRFMADAIGTVLIKLGDMFSALGSIKGAPDWIGETGEALRKAGEKAQTVADNINKIDTQKTVNIDIITRHYGDAPGSSGGGELQGGMGGFGRRTPAPSSGRLSGGKPAYSPRMSGRSAGSGSVGEIAAAMRAALEGLTVNINDDGTATFRLTGAAYA